MVSYLEDIQPQQFLCNNFERRQHVDSIYSDFHEAFDLVKHDLLKAKVKALGVNDKTLKWISYLQTRV